MNLNRKIFSLRFDLFPPPGSQQLRDPRPSQPRPTRRALWPGDLGPGFGPWAGGPHGNRARAIVTRKASARRQVLSCSRDRPFSAEWSLDRRGTSGLGEIFARWPSGPDPGASLRSHGDAGDRQAGRASLMVGGPGRYY